MILRVADDGGAAAVRLDNVALGNGFDRVVRPLAMDVRAERGQQRAHGRLWKNHDVVRRTEAPPQAPRDPAPGESAVRVPSGASPNRRHSRPRPAHLLRVTRTRDSGCGRREAGRNSRSRTRSYGRPRARPRRDGPARPAKPHYPRRRAPRALSRLTASRNSEALTVAVPRFMTTRPPA